ncbi:MAG: phosphotransferase, partial [Myxococcales bacterium]|nr:phosphotransferase [Myxococcales bacterium]
ELADRPRALCVKIGQRGAAAAVLEHAVQRAVHRSGRLPVAEPIAFAVEEPISGHPCIVSEWVDGSRLDRLAHTLSVNSASKLLERLASGLAALHRVSFERTGWLASDGDALGITASVRLDGAALCAYAEPRIGVGPGRGHIGDARADRLLEWLARNAFVLDEVAETACLCHGDFGGENILLDAGGGFCVLDWEFACAGTPSLDLGHLLRAPFVEPPLFEALLGAAYQRAGGRLSERWILQARLTDLFAWLGFLERPALGTEIVESACTQIDRLIDCAP